MRDFANKEQYKDKRRFLTMALLLFVLTTTILKPNGLVNFDHLLEGDNLLVAFQEGAANCSTTFVLKENRSFRESAACFGVGETSGKCDLKGDTLFFNNVKLGRGQKEYYDFAVMEVTEFNDVELVFYRNFADTTRRTLPIIKDILH